MGNLMYGVSRPASGRLAHAKSSTGQGVTMSLVDAKTAGSPRRASLLQAAADLFAARGYHTVSIDEIGQAVGISGPGVYRHFASKSDLLLTICDVAMDHLIDGGRAIAADADAPGRRLERLLDFHIDFAIREYTVLSVYLREQHALSARDLRALRRRQRDYEGLWCDVLGVEAGLTDGEIRAAVKLLLSMLNGTAHVRDSVSRVRLAATLSRMARGAVAGAVRG